VGEAALMGHGVQMWLQTVWFLARTPRDRTVVLDEPDVYMHPDLQRRLLQIVRERFNQLLIATHSIEIVSDVDPQSILSVDRRRNASSFVTSLPGAQEVIDSLGGVHNIQLTRLYSSPVFLLVEGEDVDLLRQLQKVVAPKAAPIDLIPSGDIGGRGGWATGFPSRLPSRNAKGEKIASYCLLDRDFFPPEEIHERYAEAQQRGVRLHIWTKKEIENFLLVPEAIARLVASNLSEDGVGPSADRISEKIDELIDAMKVGITNAFAANLLPRDKRGGLPKANKRAREIVAAGWHSREGRWSIASGKAVISALSEWSKAEFGVSFGPSQIARSLLPAEVDPEVHEALTAIAEQRKFRPRSAPNADHQATARERSDPGASGESVPSASESRSE
jgi:putative AbiEii toxin of type IV toxin-antitoxin system